MTWGVWHSPNGGAKCQLTSLSTMNTSSPHPVTPHMPHVLNYGMGVDSTAILLKWLAMSDEERGFPLCDLIVLT
ncbi:hypothetical protein, partial [Okeania sp. SIO2G5]|uniref:hypothetical protein n=1 Tax=Okeania sp. SIO2G5 TaxID=2607796 RepID=UPI00257B581B